MVASRFVEVTDKEISEIKINSVPKKTQKTCVKMLKPLFASGSVIIGEYSPRLRLGSREWMSYELCLSIKAYGRTGKCIEVA